MVSFNVDYKDSMDFWYVFIFYTY